MLDSGKQDTLVKQLKDAIEDQSTLKRDAQDTLEVFEKELETLKPLEEQEIL